MSEERRVLDYIEAREGGGDADTHPKIGSVLVVFTQSAFFSSEPRLRTFFIYLFLQVTTLYSSRTFGKVVGWS